MGFVSLLSFIHMLEISQFSLLTLVYVIYIAGQSGLFGIVRKPAYAGEQMIWISFYLFSVSAGRAHQKERYYINWSIGGCILLCLLFQGSGWLTEQISISKYREYRSYQKRVP